MKNAEKYFMYSLIQTRRKGQESMTKKLYVGSLKYGTDEEALKEAFSQAGQVESAVVITDRETGKSKGFGFVEMSTEEEAEKAIEMFNNSELDGRNITVNEARPRTERGPGGGGGGPRRRPGGFGGGRRM
jgi:cold-inducible RNA-binding protein